MICSKCKQDKSEDAFAWRNKDSGKRASECKECHRIIRRNNYEQNRERDIAGSKERLNSTRQWYQEYKSTLKCEKCGMDHPAVLDFHHKNAKEKDRSIAQGVGTFGWSIGRIQKEISKCVVLCANCHRIEHWQG